VLPNYKIAQKLNHS